MIKEFIKRVNENFFEKGAVNIVCLGDSVTQGSFTGGKENSNDAYPAKLKKLFEFYYPDRVFNIINSGIGGTTAAQAVNRFERDVLKYKPDLLLIMFGVNDSSDLPLYYASLNSLFTSANKNNIPTVYITEHMMNTYLAEDTLPELIDHCKGTMVKQLDGTMDTLFAEGKKIAEKHNIYVCDVYSKWKQLYANGVDITMLLANRTNHPVPEMHTFLASEIFNTIFF